MNATTVSERRKREGFCRECGGHLHERTTVRDLGDGFCSQDCLDSYATAVRVHRTVRNPYDRRIQIAIRYAHAHGYFGVRGGWIYEELTDGVGDVVTQGWASFEKMFRAKIRDWLTQQLTGVDCFEALLSAGTSYRPTLRPYGRRWWWTEALSDYWDQAQEERGDYRQAWRGRPLPKAEPAS